ncbi:hypothetical protein [Sinosporangium siamense]|uniref:Uncharacterized protein n=1 Tax=Sinosporangium siamense TaxID=1367973 RepID=A0A919RCX5_9ACTN|nr:hypothetical protein [Sinosporangium siamense]GII91137.1 hypothetical protein Ssi02_13680 [Sinosporangium siamense]
MSASEGAVLVHAIGGGDLGVPGAATLSGITPDYEGLPGAEGKTRRPLRKVFEGLAEAGIPLSGVVFLGTTTPLAAGSTLAVHAARMRRRLTSESGLCGSRFPPAAVHVVEIGEPGMRSTADALAVWIETHDPGEVLVTTGSGALSLSTGAVCAVLGARLPVRVLHIDRPREPYSLQRPRDKTAHLDAWLVRHRFWDALGELDEENRGLWRLLAERQAGLTTKATALAGAEAAAEWRERYGVTKGNLGKFRDRTATLQAALFERLGRGEAADYGTLRAWYADTLDKLSAREELSPNTKAVVTRLVSDLRSRAGGKGDLTGLLRMAMRDLRGDITSDCAAMIKDAELTDLYGRAATHQAHLWPAPLAPGHLSPTLTAAADRWESKDDQGVKLIQRTGRVSWPVLGSGDILALLAVGIGDPARDGDDLRAIHTVLTESRLRQKGLLRRGEVRLRLLASPEATLRAHRLARAAQRWEADIRVVDDVRGDLHEVRDVVVNALAAEAAPTGRGGSGSLRDVDEVVLVLNPGPPMTNYGMVAAGVEWSLQAACPLWLTELGRAGPDRIELRSGKPVLARLGLDHMLAQLAAGAVRRLDLRTAQRLVDRGSDALRAVLPDLQILERYLFAAWVDVRDWSENHDKGARRRLSLIAKVCGELPVPAAYLAVESLRPGLFTWRRWEEKRIECPALKELATLANGSLQGHALDRRSRGARGPRHQPNVRDVLIDAIKELGGPRPEDDDLVRRHQSLLRSLDRIFHGPVDGR